MSNVCGHRAKQEHRKIGRDDNDDDERKIGRDDDNEAENGKAGSAKNFL